MIEYVLNSLPSDKFLDWFKLIAFTDDKINVNGKLNFDYRRIENIVGKGKHTGFQHFLLFLQFFLMPSFSGSFKSELCGEGLTLSHLTKFWTRPN